MPISAKFDRSTVTDREPAHGSIVATTVYDADGYSRSVEGVEIEAVRAGPGSTHTVVRATATERLIATSCSIGFPMAARGTVGDEHVIATVIKTAVPGSRWCGIDLQGGMVVLYGPGAAHTAVNPAGAEFSLVTVELSTIAELAEARGLRLDAPPRGQVQALAPHSGLVGFVGELVGFVEAAEANVISERRREGALLDALTMALSNDRRAERVGAGRRIDSRQVVQSCVGYAESVGRIPSVSEVCLASHVSDRLLRKAFNDVFDLSPTAYFRLWGLEEAWRQLSSHPVPDLSVTRTAHDIGFFHLGRFAGRYKNLFGESPSETLRSGA